MHSFFELEWYSAMADHRLQKSLEDAISEYKCYNDRTTSLFRRTSTCFQEILESMDIGSTEAGDSNTLIPFSQLDEVERELSKSPSVFFIGERNCGKSSIINELLRQSYLPVHENPCTARIVKIKYSDEPYAVLLRSDGEEVGRQAPTKGKIPEELIVVTDQDRENENALDATVEVGLKHELLRSGIELIDSPGKGESDVLDTVLNEYLEKGSVPLFVYVIDGNVHLRKSDKETLSFLKNKFPQCLIIFVCNKVDITKEAQESDEDSDDSDDSDDEESRLDKGEVVFSQLKKSNFLTENSSKTCSLYHAISAKAVRNERRSSQKSEATERFNRFASCLQHHLGKVMKTQTRQVVQKLLVLQESFVNIVQEQRTVITEKASLLPQVVKKGNDIETKIFKSLSRLTFASDAAKERLVDSIGLLKAECVKDAEVYKPVNLRHLRNDAQTMVKTDLPDLSAELTTLLSTNDIGFQRFLSDMKGGILEKMCNSLGRFVEATMNEMVSDLTEDIIAFNEELAHPMVSRILEESYDIQFLAVKAEADELIQNVLNGLLDSIKEAVSIALRREISEPLSAIDTSSYTNGDVNKKETRKVIVSSFLETINEERVAKAVHEACCNRLTKMHELFSTAVSSLSSLQRNFAHCPVASRLERFRVRYTPEIRTLAVEGMALQNMHHRGPVELGSIIAKTRKGVIYDCISERWCKVSPSGQCAVKVLEKRSLDEAIWKQTAVDLVNMMDMIQKRHGSHPNLLRLFGWVFPQPDVLHVVMEKAERGLLSALQSGLPLPIRMNIAVDVAKGLKAIHEINYIYEDLKPENVLLMSDGTAKINLTKPEFPYEMTSLGAPFHISPEMYQHHGTGQLSYPSYDVYAFGILLWVLCEGSGKTRPRVYRHLETIEEMKELVEKEIFPERFPGITDACWDLMWSCWDQRETIRMDSVVEIMEGIKRRCWAES